MRLNTLAGRTYNDIAQVTPLSPMHEDHHKIVLEVVH